MFVKLLFRPCILDIFVPTVFVPVPMAVCATMLFFRRSVMVISMPPSITMALTNSVPMT